MGQEASLLVREEHPYLVVREDDAAIQRPPIVAVVVSIHEIEPGGEGVRE